MSKMEAQYTKWLAYVQLVENQRASKYQRHAMGAENDRETFSISIVFERIQFQCLISEKFPRTHPNMIRTKGAF